MKASTIDSITASIIIYILASIVTAIIIKKDATKQRHERDTITTRHDKEGQDRARRRQAEDRRGDMTRQDKTNTRQKRHQQQQHKDTTETRQRQSKAKQYNTRQDENKTRRDKGI